ncbi:MAG: tetratricopeptide repeat protein [Planctomycetota bacterium]|jgi:tetratricopeptide (TPR) repeat protein
MSCNDFQRHFDSGVDFYSKGKFSDAEREHKEAVRLKPASFVAHFHLGNTLYKQKKHNEAEREYREAIRLKADDPETHYNLGILLKEQEKYDEAEREYREAIRLKPDLPEAHNNLGVLLKGQKKYEEAELEFQSALQLNKNMWQSMWGLSELHVEMARATRDVDVYQDALTEINNALRITSKNPQIIHKESFLDMYLLRGYINTALGNYNEAKSDYVDCKQYDANNLKVHRNLRRINKLLGEVSSMRWIRIPLLAVSGTGLLGTCLTYFWLGKFDTSQFYAFASTTFAFIILGILLPMIRRVKVGKMEMEFELAKTTITTPSTTPSVSVEK